MPASAQIRPLAAVVEDRSRGDTRREQTAVCTNTQACANDYDQADGLLCRARDRKGRPHGAQS